MKRREFTSWVGAGLLASSLPVAIAACRSNNPPAAGSGSSDGGGQAQEFEVIGSVADLEANGSLANQAFQGQNVVVIRPPNQPDGVVALSARCTHSGCTVAWNRDRNQLICPCHGGQFGADGSVQSGPPKAPLATYTAKIENEQVWVKV